MTCRRLAMNMTRSTARPATSGPSPLDHSASVATSLNFAQGRVEYQTPDVPVCIQDRHRIIWIDAKLLAEGTESVVSVDDDVSKPCGGGKTDDMHPAMPSLAQTLCQARDGLIPEPASDQIHSPFGVYRVPDHVADHRHSRRLGVVDEVTEDVSHPPAGAPGW